MRSTQTATVVGGAMAGLAAAEGLSRAGFDVTLYERQSYAEKRVNCGEAMTAVSAIPLEPTAENGFCNPLPAMEVDVYDGIGPGRRRTGRGAFAASDAFVTDRNVVERAWAERLAGRGVDVRENRSVTRAEFDDLAADADVVVDATGQPSLTSRASGTTDEYAGHLVALNADVSGDVADLHPNGRIVLENYTGYAWAFAKAPDRANVGVGWTASERPDDYMDALRAACERNGWPRPRRERTNVAIIPEGPSIDPASTHLPERSIVRVGDAAGVANRLTGKGISQAVQSSYLAAELAAAGRLAEYPDRLYRTMKAEYLVAAVIRHLLETREPDLLGAAVRAAAGMDVEDVDRSPGRVLARLARHPILFARILSRGGVLGRAYAAARDRWEFAGRPANSP